MLHYNYFNFEKTNENEYLISNDTGKYLFLSKSEFFLLINKNIEIGSPLFEKLSSNYFISNENREAFISKVANEVSSYKDNLYYATSLHIFVLTTNCNQKCIYCQASAKSSGGMMSELTAKKAVDIAMSSPSKYLSFEFQGGEPLINFATLKFIVEYSKSINKDKYIEYSLVSNLTLLNDAMISFIKYHNISISTSLDGDCELHSKNRPFNSSDGYTSIIKNIKKLQEENINISAIQTTTRYSLTKYKEIVDQYAACGFSQIFIRPLTPLGYAKTRWDEIGYTAEEFIQFYMKCINYIKNKNINIKEGHYQIILNKLLERRSGNYTELRSPCGATIGQMAYYYNGKIYTCDEGRMLSEMGDNLFQLGDVNSSYNELTNSPVCKAVCSASCLECIPKCSDCAYSPFCGVCPAINYGIYHSMFSGKIHDYRCTIYKAMINNVLHDFK